MKKILALFLLAPMVLVACGRDVAMDEFAVCLTEEAGAEYYGAYWCPNCQRQGELFGSAKEFINYIECGEGVSDSEHDTCLLEGIEAYPTWRFANGNELIGYQGVEDLAAASGCALPGEESTIMAVPTEPSGDE